MVPHIRPAGPDDLPHILRLLKANNLPTSDLNNPMVTLFVCSMNGELAGTIGLQAYGSVGLLRSVSVADHFKNRGLGSIMVRYLLKFCGDAGCQHLFLLTTTAEAYFKKFDFTVVDREGIPLVIRETSEFKDICPASATAMVRIDKQNRSLSTQRMGK
ncbi:MAG: arsenic resistance N-acetyltransferase ArsN2 [Sediminicola sp.]